MCPTHAHAHHARTHHARPQNWSYVSRANQLARGAHEPGQETTSLAFSQDGHSLLSRSMDATLKLWDLRRWGWAVMLTASFVRGEASCCRLQASVTR